MLFEFIINVQSSHFFFIFRCLYNDKGFKVSEREYIDIEGGVNTERSGLTSPRSERS